MDLYGLNSARAEGNARTANNDLYNEQILSARDRINNTLDQEKIVAQGNLRGQQGTDTQDKVIYDVHDAMSGLNLASSFSRFGESIDAYQKAKASGATGGFRTFLSSQQAVRRGDVDKVYGSATNVGTKASSDIVTSRVNDVRKKAMPKSLGADTGTTASTPGGLSEEAQSSFLDESAAAGGTDARATAPTPAPTQDQADRAETARVQADTTRPGAPAPSEPPAELGGNMPTEDYGGAPTQTPGTDLSSRPKTNEPASSNANTPDIPDKPPTSATDELSGKVLSTTEKLKQGAGLAQTGLRGVGDVAGVIGTYEMFKNGFAKNKDGSTDRWNEVSQIAGSVGTGLDILGAFIPALEPVGQLAQAIGAVADTVDTHNKDEQATTDAQNDITNIDKTRQAQLDALPQMKTQSAPVNTMVSGGLVGSQSQHINTATQGTGSF